MRHTLTAVSVLLAAGGSHAAEPPPAGVARTDANSKTAHEQLLEKAKKGRIDVYFVGRLDHPPLGGHRLPRLPGQLEGELPRLERGQLRLGRRHRSERPVAAHQRRTGRGEPEGHRRHGRHQQRRRTRPAGGEDAKVAEITDGLKADPRRVPGEGTGRRRHPDGHHPAERQPGRRWPSSTRSTTNSARFADGKKVRYLNINDKLADKDGKLLEGMSPDRLHLSVKGYQVWADALRPVLTELLGPPAKDDLAPPPTGDPSATGRPTPPSKK